MVKSGGTLLRVAKVATLVLVLGLHTGCTPAYIESVRPEVNGGNAMIVNPGSIAGSTEDLMASGATTDNSTQGGASDSEGSTSDDKDSIAIVGNSSYYSELPYNVMAAPDYIKYLEQEVYTPIKEIIDEVGGDKLYFRVFHSGYTTVSDDTTAIQQASIYDNKAIGVGTHLYGEVFPAFAYTWLTSPRTSDVNSNTVRAARTSCLTKINTSDASPVTTWMAAAAARPAVIDSNVLKMWGNERLGADTLQQYISAVNSSVLGTVPNITLKLSLAGGRTTSITLNDTSDMTGSRYVDHLSKLSVDRLFDSYNQYKMREQVKFEVSLEDDYAKLYAYIDGYSKTIVAIGCFDGTTLEDTLGNKANTVCDIISGVYNNTEWSQISAYVPNATILQAGVKGIN